MKFKNPVKLSEIAAILHKPIIGDPDFPVTGINEIHKITPGDLTFVDYDKYYKMALDSCAGVVLIDKEVACPPGKSLIVSDDPIRDYNKLVNHYKPFEPSFQMISPTAVIGEGTHLQPGVFVGNHVTIGKNCLIHANVTICDHTIIGDNVIIHSGTVVGSDAFYYKKRTSPEKHYDKLLSCGRTIIEDYVEIGANCTISRGVSGDTILRKGCKLDNLVHIGHGTVIDENCLFAAQVGVAGKVHIERNVCLWGQVGVSKDLTIGENAQVMAQSGVDKSIPGNKNYFGSPVDDVRKKWREMALVRRLPELFNKMDELSLKDIRPHLNGSSVK